MQNGYWSVGKWIIHLELANVKLLHQSIQWQRSMEETLWDSQRAEGLVSLLLCDRGTKTWLMNSCTYPVRTLGTMLLHKPCIASPVLIWTVHFTGAGIFTWKCSFLMNERFLINDFPAYSQSHFRWIHVTFWTAIKLPEHLQIFSHLNAN